MRPIGYGRLEEGDVLIRHAIGAVLRRLRLEQGKTLRELAAAARVSMPYLSEIERGRKEASSEILATICAVLDISLNNFLTEVGAEFAQCAAVVEIHPVSEPVPSTHEIAPRQAEEHVEYVLAAA